MSVAFPDIGGYRDGDPHGKLHILLTEKIAKFAAITQITHYSMLEYKTDKYLLVSCDCLAYMKGMEANSVDCIITSPPYWAMREYDNNSDPNEVGNESEFESYKNKLVGIFQEARRILKPTGSLWLNLGDKYCDKALLGMPWRVAIALMDDGWILRNDIIWNQLKGTQSAKDRLRDSYEHVFHFVKTKKYYYNADAIRVKPTLRPKVDGNVTISSTGVSGKRYRTQIASSDLTPAEKENALAALEDTLARIRSGEINDFRMTIRGVQRPWHSDNTNISGRAKELRDRGFYIMRMGAKGPLPTDIWDIVTEDTWRKDRHFAVFPEQLLQIPLKATCPKGGVVLDPFSGTGSTVSAAVKHGHYGIGIDLSEEYTKTAYERLGVTLF